MRWFGKVTLAEKNRRIDDLNRRIDDLEREVQRYSEALRRASEALQQERNNFENFKKSIDDAARSSSFSFDFNSVKAFSVERNTADGKPVTIIGYLLPEPVVATGSETTTKDIVREWYLHCDEKQHEAIVKAFKGSRK